MIVDFHTHIYPPSLREQRETYLNRDRTFGELFADPRAKMSTAEDLIAAMDEDGVDRSVVMGIGWTDQGVAQEANDYLIDAINRYPDRLTGFAGVNPAWDGNAAAREAERCAGAGLQGIGELHPSSQGYDLGDESITGPLMEVVRERRLIVTTHSSEPVGHIYQGKGHTRPDMLWQFITQYPDVTLVCAHWGGGLPFYALMPEVAEALNNVYFDTAASPFLYDKRVFDIVAGLVGAEKILLGSDYPLLSASRLIRQVQESGLSDTDRNAILGGNAARLLGL
jgi:uncharacterized protein